MTLDNITGITKGSWTVDSLFCKSQLITCNRVNECNGVCPFEDALKHADKEQSLNEQNNEHDREWIIGCIKHDGFIKTDRFDKANQIILEALSADAEQEAVPTVVRVTMSDGSQYYLEHERDAIPTVSADRPQGEWKHTITWQPYCSNCEYVFDEDEEYSPFWKFCPMCGAEMADNSLFNDITESPNDVIESQDDVIEVVRCNDCCNLYNKDFCSFFGSPTDAMDYCSHGERRE